MIDDETDINLGPCHYCEADAVVVATQQQDEVGWLPVCDEHKKQAEDDGYEIVEAREDPGEDKDDAADDDGYDSAGKDDQDAADEDDEDAAGKDDEDPGSKDGENSSDAEDEAATGDES